MVAADYDHIWDCCCDHGMLGMALLERAAAPHIHFVDIVEALMLSLDKRIERFATDSPSIWTTHCMDVKALPLVDYPGRHLVIIAGVGGHLAAEFVDAIHDKLAGREVDILLCPVRQQFALREQLIDLDFRLRTEVLIEENSRFYEVILAVSSPAEGEHISTIGEAIWQAHTPEQATIVDGYLTQTLNHYRRMQQGSAAVQHILDAYGRIPRQRPLK